MKREKSDFWANFGPKKDLDGLPETTLQGSQHEEVVFKVSCHDCSNFLGWP